MKTAPSTPAALSKKKSERRFKIYTRYFDSCRSEVPETIPEIRLKGKWLQQMGFEEGRGITVQLALNKLVITVNE